MTRDIKPAVQALKAAIKDVRRCDSVLAEIGAEREKHMTKVGHFTELLQLMGESVSDLLGDEAYVAPDEQARLQTGHGKRMVDEASIAKSGKRTNKGMSSKWRTIMTGIIEAYPQEFDNKSLRELASSLGYEVSRPTAGRQMQDYAAGRYLERLANGKYRATELGAKSLGLKLGKKARKDETPPVGAEGVSETDSEGDASLSSNAEKVTRLFER